MTEAEWWACTSRNRMLEYIPKRVSMRKWRLMAVAFVRRIWHLVIDVRSRTAVEVAERWADGQATVREVKRAFQSSLPLIGRGFLKNKSAATAANSAAGLGKKDTWRAASYATDAADQPGGSAEEEALQCQLIRDILGYPDRIVQITSTWLLWNDGAIPKLARTIYDDRAFNHLPILADALEEAGCDDAEILSHLRGPGPHVRGCWALDLVLGRE